MENMSGDDKEPGAISAQACCKFLLASICVDEIAMNQLSQDLHHKGSNDLTSKLSKRDPRCQPTKKGSNVQRNH